MPKAFTPLPPVEKLALATRKNIRDEFESKKADYESRLAAAVGVDSFTITVNSNEIYPYAEASDSHSNIGYYLNSYFSNLTEGVEKYTGKGKDKEAQEVLQKVISTKTATLQATDKLSYCGTLIQDGQLLIIFNHKNFASNISYVADGFDKVVDEALSSAGGDELPIVARRAIAEYLDDEDKGLPHLQERMKTIFGKDFKFEWDFKAIKEKVSKSEGHYLADRLNAGIPELVIKYFTSAVDYLEQKNFKTDDMLQEGFLEATDKQIVRFEIVDKLKHGSYNDTIFENGIYLIQTVPKEFGTNVSYVGGDVIDRL